MEDYVRSLADQIVSRRCQGFFPGQECIADAAFTVSNTRKSVKMCRDCLSRWIVMTEETITVSPICS